MSTSPTSMMLKGYPPKTGPFIIKLRQAVTTCPPSCGRWSANGKRFDVLKPEEFDQFLKRYFVGTEATFLRQLHFYQFRKIDCAHGGGDGETPGTWSFVHAHFVRDDPNDDVSIKRVVGSTTRSRGGNSSSSTTPAGMIDLSTYNKSQHKVLELETELARMAERVADLERKLEASEQARLQLTRQPSTSSAEPQQQQQQQLPEALTPVSRSASALSLFNVVHDHEFAAPEDSPYDEYRREDSPSLLSDHELPNDDMVQDLMMPDESDGMYVEAGPTAASNEMELIASSSAPALSRGFSFGSYDEYDPASVNPAVVSRVVNFLRKSLRQPLQQEVTHEQVQAQADVGKMLPTLLATPQFQKALLEAVASNSFRAQQQHEAMRGYPDTMLRPNMDVF